MLKGIYEVAQDMMARILRNDAIAENLANINTSGYKTQRVFRRVLDDVASNQRSALSVQTFTRFAQGEVEITQRPLDIAINGDGFFVIETPLGQRYTRCGAFTISPAGILTTLGGDVVLGNGGPIMINGSQVSISRDGRVLVDGSEVGIISIVRFSNPATLIREGNQYVATTEEPTPVDADEVDLVQGALERSNVNPIDEMVEMIAIQRGFESDQRAIRLQDESARNLIQSAGRGNRR